MIGKYHIESIVRILDRSAVKVVAYVDDLVIANHDLVILMSGMLPSITNDIMKEALEKVCLGTARAINLTKSELMLFEFPVIRT